MISFPTSPIDQKFSVRSCLETYKMGVECCETINCNYFLEKAHQNLKTDLNGDASCDHRVICCQLTANGRGHADPSVGDEAHGAEAHTEGMKLSMTNGVLKSEDRVHNLDFKTDGQAAQEVSLLDNVRQHTEISSICEFSMKEAGQKDHFCIEVHVEDNLTEGIDASRTDNLFQLTRPDNRFEQAKHVVLDPNAREFTPTPPQYHALPVSLSSSSIPSSISLDETPITFITGLNAGAVSYNPPLELALQSELSEHSHVPIRSLLPQTENEANNYSDKGLTHFTFKGGPQAHSQHIGLTHSAIGREHVTRTLLLSRVPSDLDNAQLQCELEQWGAVRALKIEKRKEGLVTVSYFDLRHAKGALEDIQGQHLLQQRRIQEHLQLFQKSDQSNQLCKVGNEPASCHSASEFVSKNIETLSHQQSNDEFYSTKGLIGGKAVWAQYTIPCGTEAGPDGINQGTLVVFNLDADISHDALRTAFEVHGPIKELRETPARRQHKFVEFFDVRDAARALVALDGKEVCGKRVKIEFSRPGGHARRARANDQARGRWDVPQGFSPFRGSKNGPSTAVANVQGHQLIWEWSADSAYCNSRAVPCNHQTYLCSNFEQSPSRAPFASMSYVAQYWNGPDAYPHLSGCREPSIYISPTAAPLVLPESVARPIAASDGRIFGTQEFLTFGTPVSNGVFYNQLNRELTKGTDAPCRKDRIGSGTGIYFHSNIQGSCAMKSSSFGESRCSNQAGKPLIGPKHVRDAVQTRYVFDEFDALTNISPRTTVMIRNIPNKYSQQMLLELLDRHCLQCNKQIADPNESLSAYDFVYLPIDFKNKCNLGYAFVNFTTVKATVRLYKAFHSQQWEAFNSRKICQVTYARVQGKAALEEHFRNSRFNCENDEYLPLVFSPPRTGMERPAPTVAVCSFNGSPRMDHETHILRGPDLSCEKQDQESADSCK